MSLDAAIGPFILDAEIGRGGMARVYSAHHHKDGALVDLDLAWFARRAALVCEDAGKVPLAVRAWAIAHTQWTALDWPEEAAEAAAR